VLKPDPKGMHPYGDVSSVGETPHVNVIGDHALSPEPLNKQGAEMSEEVSVGDRRSAVVY
jgi:hypothetical protein